MAITFWELSTIAKLHYSKLPDAFKSKASEFFDALDQDGDGAVTLPELLNSNLEGKFGQEFIQHVFYNLDEEGKGHLGFRECLVLYYLCMYSTRICTACGRNIPHGLGYTCLKCWKEGQTPNNEFSVCLNCFSSHNYQHEHGPLHLLHDVVLFDNLLHSRPSAPTSSPLAPVRTVEQRWQKVLSGAELLKQCKTCEIKQRNGTLFWIVKGTNNTASASSPSSSSSAAANLQPRGNPEPNARPRGSSSDYQPHMHPGYGGGGGGGSGSGSSHGSDGSSRGGHINRMSMGQAPPPRPGVAPSINLSNVIDAAATGIRTVNKVVKLINAVGGAAGVGGGGGNNMFSADGGAAMFNAVGGGIGYDGSVGMGSIGGDSGVDASTLLSSLGSLVGGGNIGSDGSGFVGFDVLSQQN